MGFSLPGAKMFMELATSTPFSGRILQLGRQDIYFGQDELEKAARQVGYQLRPAEPEPLVRNRFMPGSPLVISDDYFFKRLGFQKTDSLDVSEFENATIVFDLNAESIPDQYRNQFDVLLDAGTMEHVFHLPNAFKNICDFVKPGGLVVHISPVHNYYEHGFYCFNPTFFHDFYAVNKFDLVTSQLLRFTSGKHLAQVERTFLLPWQRALDELNHVGSLDGRCYALFFAARKTPESLGTVIPQQSAYLEKWPDARDRPVDLEELSRPDEKSKMDRKKSALKRTIRKAAKQNKATLALYEAINNDLARRANERLANRPIQWEVI